jgi:DNA helicase-2/ATP-dependent DNA helicase PcrA
MSPDFLSGLNEQQLEAVTLPQQSALILAGAGSGKTRVLTTRIAWLIQTGQVSPTGLIAVTFTNKAAKEMLTRISAMLPINTRGMWVGTFHGLCNRLLRAHHREAGLPQLFQILDTQDQLSLIKRLLKSLNVDEERFPPRQVQWFVAGAKEEGLRAAGVEAQDEFTRRMKDLYAAYDEQCGREGVVDFAELLLRCYELLAGPLSGAFPPYPGGRVSGHQPAAVPLAEAARLPSHHPGTACHPARPVALHRDWRSPARRHASRNPGSPSGRRRVW